jgi:hypothetical protein
MFKVRLAITLFGCLLPISVQQNVFHLQQESSEATGIHYSSFSEQAAGNAGDMPGMRACLGDFQLNGLHSI